ncbi:hypothetical protein [Thermocatellispora tengchongensis]
MTAPATALLALSLAGLTACATGQSSPAGASPSASAATSDGTYVVGADPADDPCARVVSALGYVEPLLLPPGQEEEQRFDDAVRGRLAYVEGVLLEYGPRLPAGAKEGEAALRRTTRGLAPAATPREEQVRLLREYREAEKSVRDACA